MTLKDTKGVTPIYKKIPMGGYPSTERVIIMLSNYPDSFVFASAKRRNDKF